MSEKELASQNDFAAWLISSPRGVEGLVVSVMYVGVVAVKNVPAVSKVLPSGTFYDWLPSLFQCLALLPAFWQCFMLKPPEALYAKHPIAAKACEQFGKCLAALIAVWIGFYALVFLWEVHPINGIEPWTDLLNNMQAVFLFMCYWTLTAITIPEPGSAAGTRRPSQSMSLALVFNFSLWLVMAFLVADISLSFRASTAVQAWEPGSSRFWIQLVSGLAVGIGVALLAGCLESEYLSAPWTRSVTACLYGYAVLQLAYIGFNSHPAKADARPLLEPFLEQFATITSLPLKLLLIGFCFWAIKEGRLAFYMEKTRSLIRNVPAEWDEFRDSLSADPAQKHDAIGAGGSAGD